ncbi:MAG: hypothetical protein KF799_11230 [Bdellovibrionales bacterium]|nr:hypothetical protein [Bdellovibrionales bacterium]
MKVNDLLGFNLDDFISADEHNRKASLENLKPYCLHLTNVTDMYADLYSGASMQTFFTPSGSARFYLLSGCYVNIVKAAANIVSGHITDANIYSRRTLEAIQYSAFLRDHQEHGELWFKTFEPDKKSQFHKSYQRWAGRPSELGGLAKTYEELKLPHDTYVIASDVGAHPNWALAVNQNSFKVNGKKIDFKIFFNELGNDRKDLLNQLQMFLWHLRNHFHAIDWWVEFSGIEFGLAQQRMSFWRDCRREFTRACEKVRPIIHKEFAGNSKL